MNKIIFIVLLFASTILPQNVLLLMDGGTVNPAQTLTDAYISRVEADGGTIIDGNKVLEFYTDAIANNYLDSITCFISADFGVKFSDATTLSKLYDITGNYDFTPGLYTSFRYWADTLVASQKTWVCPNGALGAMVSALVYPDTGSIYIVWQKLNNELGTVLAYRNVGGSYIASQTSAINAVWSKKVASGTVNAMTPGDAISKDTVVLQSITWGASTLSNQINNQDIVYEMGGSIGTSGDRIVIGDDIMTGYNGWISMFVITISPCKTTLREFLKTKYSIY